MQPLRDLFCLSLLLIHQPIRVSFPLFHLVYSAPPCSCLFVSVPLCSIDVCEGSDLACLVHCCISSLGHLQAPGQVLHDHLSERCTNWHRDEKDMGHVLFSSCRAIFKPMASQLSFLGQRPLTWEPAVQPSHLLSLHLRTLWFPHEPNERVIVIDCPCSPKMSWLL
jgi:hypothetical protein